MSTQFALTWLIIGPLIATSLLSSRSTALLMACIIGGVSLLPAIRSDITYQSLLGTYSFLGIGSLLIIANTIFRNRLIADRNRDINLEKTLTKEIIDNFPGILFLYNLSSHLFRSNKHYEEIVGPQLKELNSSQLIDLFQGMDKPTAEKMAAQASSNGMAQGDIVITAKNNSTKIYYLTLLSRTIRDDKYLIGFGTDITEFKRVEDARQAVVDNSLIGLAIYLDDKIVFSNPTNAKLFGYSEEELYALGPEQISNLIFAEDRDLFFDRMHATVKQEKTIPRLETRIIRKDGSLRWLEVSFNTVYYDGRPAIQVASADITERKFTEAQQSRLISELEAKNAELERFTYTVSHDLKSPLITIRGFLGFLERDAIANNKARIEADLQRITDATEKMQRLLNDLLKLSRVGHVVNPPEDLPFEVIVKEAIEKVGGQILQRGIHIKIGKELPMVRVDRERAVEIVQNLVDNAAKFMGDQADPQIEIDTCGTEGTGMAIFFVKDNGIGIDPQFHDRIFGLFNKLDPASEGTGVGLALVKRIIEVHGGKIWVLSKGKGDGTTFYFTLPLTQQST